MIRKLLGLLGIVYAEPARSNIDYGDGLTRLADPVPDVWIADTTQVLSCTRRNIPGPAYGNFWSPNYCVARDHTWLVLMVTDQETGYPREVRRCQNRQCGSQVHQWIEVSPPRRGAV